MKKTIFLGIAVLLALAVFSCGDPTLPQDEVGITLGVKDSAGRALVGVTSEAGTNFYEAAFQKSGNPIVRATWNFARNGKIKIEPGTYKVILMAGRNADKTLLGVGAATSITGKSATLTENGSVVANNLEVTITTSTTDITFTVFPLMNDIKTTSGSTFLTTAPTQAFPTPTTRDELGNIYPIFMINQGPTPSVATWTYGIRALTGTGALGATPAAGNLISTFGSSVVVAKAANGTPQFFVTGLSVPEELDIPQLLANTPTFSLGASPADPLSGSFEMTFTAKASSDGIVQVAFQVPVVAFSDDPPDNPVIWYIRGGLNNGSLDAGIGTDGVGGGLPAKSGMLGGAIVLGFGNLSAFPDVYLHQQ